MATRSNVRYFRKAALCTLFALAAGASISASAQKQKTEQVIIQNYSVSSGVKGFWMQYDDNGGGWACFPVDPATLLPSGRALPGGAKAPAILYNKSYSFYALSSTDCSNGGQRISRLSKEHYKVTDPKVKNLVIGITDYNLIFGQN